MSHQPDVVSRGRSRDRHYLTNCAVYSRVVRDVAGGGISSDWIERTTRGSRAKRAEMLVDLMQVLDIHPTAHVDLCMRLGSIARQQL
jgi:hypothetical protein